jgi:hypothetical protein
MACCPSNYYLHTRPNKSFKVTFKPVARVCSKLVRGPRVNYAHEGSTGHIHLVQSTVSAEREETSFVSLYRNEKDPSISEGKSQKNLEFERANQLLKSQFDWPSVEADHPIGTSQDDNCEHHTTVRCKRDVDHEGKSPTNPPSTNKILVWKMVKVSSLLIFLLRSGPGHGPQSSCRRKCFT